MSAAAQSPDWPWYTDIHAQDVLPELAARTHWRRELILLTSNYNQLDLTANLIASLERFGHKHYILLADNAELVSFVAQQRRLKCVWSSMLLRFAQPVAAPGETLCPASCGDPPGGSIAMKRGSRIPSNLAVHDRDMKSNSLDAAKRSGNASCRQLQRRHCLPSPLSFYNCDTVRQLWLLRHHYTARLIGLRYNVLLLDSDSMIVADPYPYLHTYMGNYTAICSHDDSAGPQMKVNGGTFYVRGAQVGGPVHRIFEGTAQRMLKLLEDYPGVKLYRGKKPSGGESTSAEFLLFDQEVVNLQMLEVAVGHSLAMNGSRQFEPPLGRRDDKRSAWQDTCCFETPAELCRDYGAALGAGQQRHSTPASNALLTRQAHQSLASKPYQRIYQLRVLRLREPGTCAQPDGGLSVRGASSGSACEGSVRETVVKAPAWLVSSEADQRRPSATPWGLAAPPMVIVHFVCSSWPGSDGRRGAMRLWGHWHTEAVVASMGPAYASAEARRTRRFVAFAKPVPALTPKELTPYLRVLALFSALSDRTPVLPLMPCGPPAHKPLVPAGTEAHTLRDRSGTGHRVWTWPALDPNGMPRHRERGSWLACGWALHHVGGVPLPHPLCVQRLHEGCFGTFAMPTELGPLVPDEFWNWTAPNTSSAPRSMFADSPRFSDLSELLELGRRMGPDKRRVLLVDVPSEETVASLRELQNSERFWPTLRQGSNSGAALQALASCSKMLSKANGCAAVTCGRG